MRVLHVVASDQRRGGELFASDLVVALGGNGVSQHVAVLHGREPIGFPISAPSTIVAEVRSSGSLRGVRPGIVSGLRRLVRRVGPDIIQAHGGEPLKYSVLAANHSGARIVYRRIGSALGRGIGSARRAVHGGLMRRADRVVAVAEALRRETVATFGLPADRVVTIPNAVDPARMEATRSGEEVRRTLGIGRDVPVILSLGALTWEKDPAGHLDATAPILRQTSAVHVFAGDGPLRGQLVRAIRERGLEGSVLLLGPRADVADLLAATDVVLVASRTEGMPGCILEAGLRGVPTVGYALTGVPEVVESGVTGLLAPPGDPRRLGASVAAILADGQARTRMGAAARERYRTSFDIRQIAPRYLSLYEEVRRR